MKKIVIKILSMSAFIVLLSCGGSGGGGGSDDDDPIVTIPDPSAATLIYPENNKECTTGSVINDTEVAITFEWNLSDDTDTYELNIRNLESNSTSKHTSTDGDLEVTIDRGTPYEWYIISMADGTSSTATSSKWKFYSEGEGQVTYAPFPAEVDSPERGSSFAATSSVTLSWIGSDVEDDIEEYEVFFGTDPESLTSEGTTSTMSMSVSVASGNVYYWQIKTSDSNDNYSLSEIFDFRVE